MVPLSGYVAVLGVFRDVLQGYFGVTLNAFGLLLSIGLIPGAISGVAAGAAISRWGPRAVLRTALAGSAAAMALTAATGRCWGLMLAAVALHGVFTQAVVIAASAYLVQLFETRPRRIMSLCMVAGSLGGILFPLLAEWLLAVVDGGDFALALHLPFCIVGLLLAAGWPAYAARFSPVADVDAPPPDPARPDRWWRFSPAGLMLIALCSLHGVCDSGAFAWMPRVLGGRSYAELVFRPGHVMAAAALAYVVSRNLLALLPERLGASALLVGPGLLGGAAMTAGLLTRSQTWTAVGYVAAALLFSCEYPAMLAVLADIEKRRFGAAYGLIALVTGTLGFVLVCAMGWIGTAVGEQRLWLIMLLPAAGFPLVGLGGLLWLIRYGRRR